MKAFLSLDPGPHCSLCVFPVRKRRWGIVAWLCSHRTEATWQLTRGLSWPCVVMMLQNGAKASHVQKLIVFVLKGDAISCSEIISKASKKLGI